MKEKEDEENIEEIKENIINNKEKKDGNNNTKLIKVNSSELLITNGDKKEDTFEIINKNKEFDDYYGF